MLNGGDNTPASSRIALSVGQWVERVGRGLKAVSIYIAEGGELDCEDPRG